MLFVIIILSDIPGREINDFFNGNEEAGLHKISFDVSDFPVSLSCGVYLYNIYAQYKNGDYKNTKKMVLLK